MDPRGRDIPAAFEHPGLGARPAPGRFGRVPPGIVKPIPINTRSVAMVMRRQLNREEPKLIRVLVNTINASREALKFQEIRNALETGNITQATLNRWREQYSRLVVDDIAPRYFSVMEANGVALTSSAAQIADVRLPFAAAQRRIDAWIAQRGADLAVMLTNQQVETTRAILRVAANQQLNPRDAERFLRPVIGLDPRSAQAVANRRAAMIADGVTGTNLERRTRAYADRLLRVRTQRIARTELATAWNQAGQELLTEAVFRGDIADAFKTWLTADDERVCPVCGPLDGSSIAYNETFPTLEGPVFTPPAHPSCRCTTTTEIIP